MGVRIAIWCVVNPAWPATFLVSSSLKRSLKLVSRLSFIDAAGYTMVKKNWFNGVQMPSIAVRQLDGSVEVAREFSFDDFLNGLS